MVKFNLFNILLFYSINFSFKCKTCQSKLKTQTKILIESDGLLCEHCSILIHD